MAPDKLVNRVNKKYVDLIPSHHVSRKVLVGNCYFELFSTTSNNAAQYYACLEVTPTEISGANPAIQSFP